MTRTLVRIFHDDEGQDLIEYALIAALISVNSVLAIESGGVTISDPLRDVNRNIVTAS